MWSNDRVYSFPAAAVYPELCEFPNDNCHDLKRKQQHWRQSGASVSFIPDVTARISVSVSSVSAASHPQSHMVSLEKSALAAQEEGKKEILEIGKKRRGDEVSRMFSHGFKLLSCGCVEQKENHHTGRPRGQDIHVSCQGAISRCCCNYYGGEAGSEWKKYEEQQNII